MKVNATYEDGRLHFHTPLALRHARVEVIVEIPDAETETIQFDETTQHLIDELQAIRNAPVPPEWDAESLSKIDRLDAFGRYRGA